MNDKLTNRFFNELSLGNQIGNYGLMRLGNALRDNATLTKLNLNGEDKMET